MMNGLEDMMGPMMGYSPLIGLLLLMVLVPLVVWLFQQVPRPRRRGSIRLVAD
jgi:hypothetical protein